MNEDLEKVRHIWLDPSLEEEDRRDNEEKIKEWERSLIENEAFLRWQEHDITQSVVQKARETYKDICLILATNRELTERQRHEYWGRQDAVLWIISLADRNAKQTLEQIQLEVRTAAGKV